MPTHRSKTSLIWALLFSLSGISAAIAAPFAARGNEPFWSIRIADEKISFSLLGAEQFVISPAASETHGNIQRYKATVRDEPFTLEISGKICADTMTGMPHPNTVAASWGDRNFSGCGGNPETLLSGDWRIVEINGKSIVSGSSPSLTFTPGFKTRGNASCNRFTGSYSITGESLTISPVALTRMACKQPLMKQEHQITGALELIDRFNISPEGRLVLIGADTPRILAEKK